MPTLTRVTKLLCEIIYTQLFILQSVKTKNLLLILKIQMTIFLYVVRKHFGVIIVQH